MRIVVMPGDDIGPEITEVTMTMLEAVNRAYALGMEFETSMSGWRASENAAIPCLKPRCRKRWTPTVSFWDRAA